MNKSRRAIPILGIVAVALTPVTFLWAILATIILDALVNRPVPASITTLLPGVAYAVALVMKVCMAETVIAAVIALVSRARHRRLAGLAPATATVMTEDQEDGINARKKIPIWGVLSVALTPLAPLLGALAVLLAQALVDKPDGISMSYFPRVARTGVFAMLACLALGVGSAIIALVKSERPRVLPVLGLVTNAFLIGLFRHFEFYALGFDQDTWAPR